MIASTAQPDKYHTTFNEWVEYIANENAAIRAVNMARRHLRFCDLAQAARDIQRNRRK